MDKEYGHKKKDNDADFIDVRSVVSKAFYHWPLYLLILIVFFFIGKLYLRYKSPVYATTAKIYISDDKKGGAEANALKDISLFNNSRGVENEMEIIKSPLILKDVIHDRGFNIRYFEKGRIGNFELYKASPFNINILSDSANIGNYVWFVDLSRTNKVKVDQTNGSGEVVKSFSTNINQPFIVGKDTFSISYNLPFTPKEGRTYLLTIDSIMPLAYRKANEITTTITTRTGSVFDIRYEDPSAHRCADFLNAVLESYNDYMLVDKNKIAKNTIQFIDSRLQSLGLELNTVEREVEQFKVSRGITEIQENSRIFLDQVKEADQQLNQTNIQLSIYDQVEKYINNASGSRDFTPTIGSQDPGLNSNVTRLDNLLAEKTKLSLSLQPNNILLENINKQIADAKATIRSYISGQRRNMLTQRSILQRQVNNIEKDISQIPSYERQFINIKRQQGVKEALYHYLLQKREEAAISSASNIVGNKIISPAYIPEGPISPNKLLVMVSFMFAGIVLTSLYLIIKYLSNNRIISKKEIETVFSSPVIAEIFEQEASTINKLEVNDRTILKEQLLNLRNNLKFMLTGIDSTPVIMFTSSISGEGKTFLSGHMANSLTYNNKSVALLELDLRKPKLAQSLGVNAQLGITNYIIGAASLESIIKKVPGTENLFILPSGPVPPNPIELLESEKMKELFKLLRARFDYVIIDTSPIGLVSDAKSLAPNVDCLLFVVRFNYTPKAKLEAVSEDVTSEFFKRKGFIFNGIETSSSFGNYGYGYSSYSYGYGDNTRSKTGFVDSMKTFSRRFF